MTHLNQHYCLCMRSVSINLSDARRILLKAVSSHYKKKVYIAQQQQTDQCFNSQGTAYIPSTPYKAANFLQNSHKGQTIARPFGRGMGCLFCFYALVYILLPQSLHWYMQYTYTVCVCVRVRVCVCSFVWAHGLFFIKKWALYGSKNYTLGKKGCYTPGWCVFFVIISISSVREV